MDVIANAFSDSAKEKIQSAGGKCLTYNEMIKATPKGTDVMVIG